jgi:hypothetical protein
VKAEDKFIFQNDLLSSVTFTSVVSGWKYSDDMTYISGPNYIVNPTYSGASGTYSIIPSAYVFGASANYTISYQIGTLYVNPKSNGAKNIKPVLLCVSQLPPNHPSGYAFVAHFSYQNQNSSPVYIPIGPENYLQSTGSYDGSNQPIVFNAGGGTFDVPFDGTKLTWVVISFRGNQKTSSASDASSTSNRCSTSKVEEEALGIFAYPNPAQDYVNIAIGEMEIESNDIRISDIVGRDYTNAAEFSYYNGDLQINTSRLPRGAYLLTVKHQNGEAVFKVMLQ